MSDLPYCINARSICIHQSINVSNKYPTKNYIIKEKKIYNSANTLDIMLIAETSAQIYKCKHTPLSLFFEKKKENQVATAYKSILSRSRHQIIIISLSPTRASSGQLAPSRRRSKPTSQSMLSSPL